MYINQGKVLVSIGFGLMVLLGIGTLTASASPVSDISDGVNNALFGGSNLFAARSILTAAVMVAVGFPLAMMKLDMTANFIILFCVLGALTAIGWADPTLILVAALIAVGFFVRKITTYFTGGGATADE